jgi:hypothetical protein
MKLIGIVDNDIYINAFIFHEKKNSFVYMHVNLCMPLTLILPLVTPLMPIPNP